VEDGVTGYLCQTTEELAEAALRVRRDIARRQCRLAVQRRFSAEHMARNYAAVYERVLQPHSHFVFPTAGWLGTPLADNSIHTGKEQGQPLLSTRTMRHIRSVNETVPAVDDAGTVSSLIPTGGNVCDAER
jgi:hypothetical protein